MTIHQEQLAEAKRADANVSIDSVHFGLETCFSIQFVSVRVKEAVIMLLLPLLWVIFILGACYRYSVHCSRFISLQQYDITMLCMFCVYTNVATHIWIYLM